MDHTVRYGFADGKPHSIDIRVKRNDDGWLLWFNDDCAGFDPTKYLQEPAESGQHNGIRMVRSLATEISYVNALGLNHLVICVKIAP